MAKIKYTVMAGCLDERTSLYFIFITNLILGGFYYAFAGMDAMRFSALAFALAMFYDLLNTCGFPFAEAAYAARAVDRNDYKTAVYVRKASCVLSFSIAALFAVVCIAAGRPLASLILGSGAPAEDITMAYVVMILIGVYAPVSCAVSWLRGFYQGVGEMHIDQRSQLLFCGAFYLFSFIVMVIMVFGLHQNRADSVYALCGSLIIAKLLTLGYYVLFDRLRYKKFKAMAKAQIILPMQKNKVFSSLLVFTAPSYCMALCAGIFALTLSAGIYQTGASQAVKYVSVSAYHGLSGLMIAVFALIPVLFASAQFEHFAPIISRVRIDEDKRNAAIEKMLIRYMAYALGYSFVLGCLGPEIVHLFYGTDFPVDALLIMRIESAMGMLAGLSVLTARLMIILELGKNAMAYALISCAAHIGMFIALPLRFGMEGMLYAGVASLSVFLFLCFTKISNRREVSFVHVAIMTFRIILACMAMNGVYALIRLSGLATMGTDILFDGLIAAGMALAGAVVYTFVLSISQITLKDPSRKKKKSK